MKLEELAPGARVGGVGAGSAVTVVSVEHHGEGALTLVFRDGSGRLAERMLFREDEAGLVPIEEARAWAFDADGALFKLASEAERIRNAPLFDPLLAVQTSDVEPLPHQITAVYETMLPRQPLRFLLADDPGAGKTIMAGLLIKELIARGDAARCLIVCPGNLVEQWQDELSSKFGLDFEILTRDRLQTAASGNWFLETPRGIARLDMLARREEIRPLLEAPDSGYDLVVCDEAHKMSARSFGGEVKFTKRYRLGELLAARSRHLLLLTATPHRGIEGDYRLFLALLDPDRFEGRIRQNERRADDSDLIRRVVKEDLFRFDGRRLFPSRCAYTVPYRLSAAEMQLYHAVTDYVRDEFNRAETAGSRQRRTVGFALTVLQRRLASSPEAILVSLRRRRKRLEKRRAEMEAAQRGGQQGGQQGGGARPPEPSFRTVEESFPFDDLDELPEDEIARAEAEVLDQATAARTIPELTAELSTLRRLERLARQVRLSGEDAKWRGLQGVLEQIFGGPGSSASGEPPFAFGAGPIPPPQSSPHHKLVLFTEHRATLEYLEQRIGAWTGRPAALAVIHGGLGREQRRLAQERFLNEPEVRLLLATDAAGEGINLQRAHLMVNYDLPWNPNRIEQRFGRIHRIGQTEVCYLWNLVASGTREGDVYERLLQKLEQARAALGGKVFDVLGRLEFEGRPLRELLLEAIREGNRPEIRAKLEEAVEGAVDAESLRHLIDEQALATEVMEPARLARVREEMERAAAHRLQPHFIGAFFRLALTELGGTIRQREPGRYQISHVPARVRETVPERFAGRRKPVVRKYERVVFDRQRARVAGKPDGEFVAPGHPLLDAVVWLVGERWGGFLPRGAVLVDEGDPGTKPRVIASVSHAVEDGTTLPSGARRVVSRRLLHVEIGEDGSVRECGYAPYLDLRPLDPEEPSAAEVLGRPECAWITPEVGNAARNYAITELVPAHLGEVRDLRLERIRKTKAAVRERLRSEIAHWDRRAEELKEDERAGKPAARMNSGEARERADRLQERLKRRLAELAAEADLAAAAPRVRGGMLVAPAGLIAAMTGTSGFEERGERAPEPADTAEIAARARAIVMAKERELGFEPRDCEFEKRGYDIESRDSGEPGRLRFLEVKGRAEGADTITVTRNEVLTALNQPEDYILAIVRFGEDGRHELRYARRPFETPPDDGAASVNYRMKELWESAAPPS